MQKIIVRIPRSTKGPDDWKQFLADPEKQWRKGYSAMACAWSWEKAKGLPTEIAELLGQDAKLILAVPEHKVSIPGRGGDSQCDVFALVRRSATLIAAAIEAKVNESFDKTVSDWLAVGGQNRRDRLDGLCDILGASRKNLDGLRYQLFHRTAAAILEADRFGADEAAMIVQSFSPEQMWRDDFDAFVAHLGADSDGGGHSLALADGKKLFLGWASCQMPDEAAA